MPTIGEINRARTGRGIPSQGAGDASLPLGASLAADVVVDGTAAAATQTAPPLVPGGPRPGPGVGGGEHPLPAFVAVRFIPGFHGEHAVPMQLNEQMIRYAGR